MCEKRNEKEKIYKASLKVYSSQRKECTHGQNHRVRGRNLTEKADRQKPITHFNYTQ
jgi:hypothetical protein